MPRYFFDVRQGESLIRDEDGIVLGGIEDVSKEAAAIPRRLGFGHRAR